LLHDNASSHKAAIVREYLKKEKVVELPRPPYSKEFAPCHLFSISEANKNTLLDENIKHKQISVRLFIGV
jgi:hypothetical protein